MVRRVRFVLRGAACGCGLSRVGGCARCGGGQSGEPRRGEALNVACGGFGLRVFGRLGWAVCLGCRRWMRAEGSLLAHQPRVRRVCGQAALPGVAFVPYARAVPDGGRRGFEAAVAVRAPIV